MKFDDGKAKRLDDIDLPKIGVRIGVGEDELHAVMDVETPGYGFDKKGRPLILFERHIFHRQLPESKRAAAREAGLATKRWSRATYNQDQYSLLNRAMRIDKEAALKSCSWGFGQIMGFNHKLAGYDTVEQMVEHFKEDEEHHINAMVTFIINAGLADNLRNHDWSGFAKGYNGKGYKANRYDEKLAAAYAKWKRIKDTPYNPGAKELVDKLARPESNTKKTSILTGITGVVAISKPVKDAIETAKDFGDAVVTAGPWIVVLLILAVGAFYIWRERDKYAKMAKSVQSVMSDNL